MSRALAIGLHHPDTALKSKPYAEDLLAPGPAHRPALLANPRSPRGDRPRDPSLIFLRVGFFVRLCQLRFEPCRQLRFYTSVLVVR